MKRLLSGLLAALLLLALGGCGNFLEKEYYVEEPYIADIQEDEPLEDTISTYAALKRAITRLVRDHVESALLEFRDYDGSIGQDISTACWEVKSSSALGAFAVDYISYDTTRIVSYYQAQLYITYKRTAEQVSAIESVSTVRAMNLRLDGALRNGETYLALRVTAASVTAEEVEKSVRNAYYSNALSSPVPPEVSVSTFPEEGVERILEIELDYGMSPEEWLARREAVAEVCALMTADLLPAEETAEGDSLPPTSAPVLPEREADTALSLAQRLCGMCSVSPEGGSTAYDALVLGSASPEGLSLAYQALCLTAGLDCVTVIGRYRNEEHFWNLLTVDGIPAHTDLSRWNEGAENVYLLPDGLMGDYWWETDAYTPCPEDYNYFGLRAPLNAVAEEPENEKGGTPGEE